MRIIVFGKYAGIAGIFWAKEAVYKWLICRELGFTKCVGRGGLVCEEGAGLETGRVTRASEKGCTRVRQSDCPASGAATTGEHPRQGTEFPSRVYRACNAVSKLPAQVSAFLVYWGLGFPVFSNEGTDKYIPSSQPQQGEQRRIHPTNQ